MGGGLFGLDDVSDAGDELAAQARFFNLVRFPEMIREWSRTNLCLDKFIAVGQGFVNVGQKLVSELKDLKSITHNGLEKLVAFVVLKEAAWFFLALAISVAFGLHLGLHGYIFSILAIFVLVIICRAPVQPVSTPTAVSTPTTLYFPQLANRVTCIEVEVSNNTSIGVIRFRFLRGQVLEFPGPSHAESQLLTVNLAEDEYIAAIDYFNSVDKVSSNHLAYISFLIKGQPRVDEATKFLTTTRSWSPIERMNHHQPTPVEAPRGSAIMRMGRCSGSGRIVPGQFTFLPLSPPPLAAVPRTPFYQVVNRVVMIEAGKRHHRELVITVVRFYFENGDWRDFGEVFYDDHLCDLSRYHPLERILLDENEYISKVVAHEGWGLDGLSFTISKKGEDEIQHDLPPRHFGVPGGGTSRTSRMPGSGTAVVGLHRSGGIEDYWWSPLLKGVDDSKLFLRQQC